MFKKPTIQIAKDLLGMYLVHETKEGKIVGKIVETEAYLKDDPGSHSHNGMSKRNEHMFGREGIAYVYLIYGMYHCFNVVTNKEGVGEAVLIRALEPVEGIELMKKKRKVSKEKDLCSGPGKLCIAMGIEKKHSSLCLKESHLKLVKKKNKKFEIFETTRIGLSQGKDLPYRFYIKGNEFVSKK